MTTSDATGVALCTCYAGSPEFTGQLCPACIAAARPLGDPPSKKDEALDLLSWAWTVIANASEGDWSREGVEWQDAARRWRDKFHDFLGRG